jgi:hypothetical protein
MPIELTQAFIEAYYRVLWRQSGTVDSALHHHVDELIVCRCTGWCTLVGSLRCWRRPQSRVVVALLNHGIALVSVDPARLTYRKVHLEDLEL